jgi:DNA-binding Lrp family transcriptional regulator
MLTLDVLDRELLHALHIDARASFSRIAAVLGTSTQTAARRYHRLRSEAGLRIVGLADPERAARQQWFVRLTATPRAAQEIARSLARRPDTSWVRLTSGGTEIVAIVQTTPGSADSHALLLRDVPRTSGVTAVSAHYLLHLYLGGGTAWRGRADALTAQQQDALRPAPAAGTERAVTLDDTDHRLLAALQHDGRTSYTDLAAVTGWSASTVTRRVEELRGQGVLFFDLEVDDALLGITTSALLWMSVMPAHLDAVATELAGHRELAVVAATTGPTNLLAHVLSPGPEALHHYLTTRLPMTAITHIETAPVLRTLKAVAPRTLSAG